MSPEEQAAFQQPILDEYNGKSSSIYSSARLWDDGIIDPADTRKVIGLSLSVCDNAPIPDMKYGVYRM